MLDRLLKLRHSLASKLIILVGIVLVCSMSTWAYFTINYQQKKLMGNILNGTDRLTTTIMLGTHYAMMHNSRDDINQIITNIAKQPDIKNIRIYNKQGQIKYSNDPSEVDRTTNIKAEACDICHRTDPPSSELALKDRTRIFPSSQGTRLLGIIGPIGNEPGCATGECHVHPEGKMILGALDVVVSLARTDAEIIRAEKGIIGLSAFVFVIMSAIIFIFVMLFVNHPIKKLIAGTRQIARGNYLKDVKVNQDDEMGQLASAINSMGKAIAKSQAELNKQRDQYQNLFEQVPCLITVQDKKYKLLRYNREFAERFNPHTGDFCYQAYKGRTQKCDPCPVEKTFATGESHSNEESAVDENGTMKHWLVKTSPIRDEHGEIVAAMEISLDITERRLLEVELQRSEKKYHDFFNNIPNPVFVLDSETMHILDGNNSVKGVYGYDLEDLIQKSFLDLFHREEREHYAFKLRNVSILNQVKHVDHAGKTLFVNIRISPSEYAGRRVLLVTTSDITKRLEAEQQLIQASKMATLGEMATGVAHELNQPLSVIKTASSFFVRKIEKREPIDSDVLKTMLTKVDDNVDRATKIINHMRQFARKSDLEMEKVQINDVLENAFEIFSQQLKVRGIDVVWEIEANLPKIYADSGRLEQVIINLLLNARDTIEEKWELTAQAKKDGTITLRTSTRDRDVVCEICDTGRGIPAEIANKIFEPFFTTKEVGKGTGLGLSISYGIVKDCGGDIRATAKNGQGTCFILTFPIPA